MHSGGADDLPPGEHYDVVEPDATAATAWDTRMYTTALPNQAPTTTSTPGGAGPTAMQLAHPLRLRRLATWLLRGRPRMSLRQTVNFAWNGSRKGGFMAPCRNVMAAAAALSLPATPDLLSVTPVHHGAAPRFISGVSLPGLLAAAGMPASPWSPSWRWPPPWA